MADAVTDFFIPDYFYEPKPESLELTAAEWKYCLAFVGFLQYVVLISLFGYFYMDMSTEEITTVTISSTILPSPYACNTLSPYTGQEVYNYSNAESGIFAKALFNYDDCYSSVGGKDLCEQTLGVDNFKTVSSFTSTSSFCLNLGLQDVDLCYDYPTTNGFTHATLGTSLAGTLDYVPVEPTWLRIVNSELLAAGDSNNLFILDDFPDPDMFLNMKTITSDSNHTVFMFFHELSGKQTLLMYDAFTGIKRDIFTMDMMTPFEFLGYDIDAERDLAYVYIGKENGPSSYVRTVLRILDISLNITAGVDLHNTYPADSDIVTSYTIQCPNTDLMSDSPDVARPISVSQGNGGMEEDKIYVACGWIDFEYFEIAEYDISTDTEIDYSIQVFGIEGVSGMGPPTDMEMIDQILAFPQESAISNNNTIFIRGSIAGETPQEPSTYFVVQADLYSFQYPEVYVAPVGGGGGPPPPTRRQLAGPPGPSAPADAPTPAPSAPALDSPTPAPSEAPTKAPTSYPTSMPTYMVTVAAGYMRVVADIPFSFEGNNYINRIPQSLDTVFVHDAEHGFGQAGGIDTYLNLSMHSFNFSYVTPTPLYHTSEAIVGMQYSTCGGNTTTDLYGFMPYVAYSEFRQAYCTGINGMYYQRSDLIDMPDSCKALGPNPATLLADTVCNHDLQTMWSNLKTECRTSYHKLCTTAYTDNPPFACIHSHNPTLIVALSNTFAGTEFAYVIFSFVAIAIFSWIVPRCTKFCYGPSRTKIDPRADNPTAVPVVTDKRDVEKGIVDEVEAF